MTPLWTVNFVLYHADDEPDLLLLCLILAVVFGGSVVVVGEWLWRKFRRKGKGD